MIIVLVKQYDRNQNRVTKIKTDCFLSLEVAKEYIEKEEKNDNVAKILKQRKWEIL